MIPSLVIAGILFYDAPKEIEGAPYWVDLWTDVNGYKIGLQVKPNTYHSANASIYMGKARTSENRGHKEFYRDYGGKVFTINPTNGVVGKDVEKQIVAEKKFLMTLPKNKEPPQ